MDDSLFDDTPHPDVSAAPKEEAKDASLFDDSLFDDTPHPEAEAKPKMGKGRAALVGANEGIGMGFTEEVTALPAALAAIYNGVPDLPYEEKGTLGRLEKLTRLMDDYKKVAREETKTAQTDQPGAYLAGNVGGSLLIPGTGIAKLGGAAEKAGVEGLKLTAAKIGAGAAEGATQAAIQGAGQAEGGLEERGKAALEMAPVGAVGGAIVPAAGQAMKTGGAVVKAAGELPIVSDLTEAFGRGAKGQNLITTAGRQEASDIVRAKSGELYGDIKELTNQVGEQIGSKIDEATAAGTKVDLTDDVTRVMDQLDDIQANGSKDAADNAASIQAEIKKILKIKDPAKVSDEMAAGPEGLLSGVDDAAEEVATKFEVDPKTAQDIKQVLKDYAPRKGMEPQKLESARAAKDLSKSAGGKLDEATGLDQPTDVIDKVTGEVTAGPSLNKQYGGLKESLKRLGVNEKKLPAQIQDQINQTVARLDRPNMTGDNARVIIDDVLAKIRQVDPEIAAKYEAPLEDAVKRLDLASKTIGGGETFGLLGTPRALATTGANAAGLAAGKVAGAPVIKQTIQAGGVLLDAAKAVSPLAPKAVTTATTQGQDGQKKLEPYKMHRQVAKIAETSDPETLIAQATQVRQQYGEQGNSLATILENMSNQKPDSRRALMFMVLQNPAYKKMLGLGKENE